MAIRLADTLKSMGDFPVAEGVDIDVNINGTPKRLQDAIEDGDIGGSDAIWEGSHGAWDSLSLAEKAKYKYVIFNDDYNENIIKDDNIAENTTWSSKKINDEFSDVNVNLGVLEDSVDGLDKRISPSVFLNTGAESKTLKFTELLQYLIDNDLYDITKSQHKLIALRNYDAVYWTFTDDVNTSSPLTAITSRGGYIEINTYRDGQTWKDGGYIRVGNSRDKRVWEYSIGSKTLYELATMDKVAEKVDKEVLNCTKTPVTDLNNLGIGEATTYVPSTLNRPPHDYGYVICFGANSNAWKFQLAFTTTNGVYVRQNINFENWGTWKSITLN